MTLETGDREGIQLLREAFDSAHFDTAHIRPMLRADSDSLTPRPRDIAIVVRLSRRATGSRRSSGYSSKVVT